MIQTLICSVSSYTFLIDSLLSLLTSCCTSMKLATKHSLRANGRVVRNCACSCALFSHFYRMRIAQFVIHIKNGELEKWSETKNKINNKQIKVLSPRHQRQFQ